LNDRSGPCIPAGLHAVPADLRAGGGVRVPVVPATRTRSWVSPLAYPAAVATVNAGPASTRDDQFERTGGPTGLTIAPDCVGARRLPLIPDASNSNHPGLRGRPHVTFVTDETTADSAPRTGSILTRALGRSILALAGWRIQGTVPAAPRAIAVVAPHTSNWDFAIGYSVKLALGLNANWLGKHTLFRGLLGRIAYALGGLPVDRTAPTGLVAQIVQRFREQPNLYIGIAPEGTRRKTDHWKTGFYYMARDAGVPIWPVALDWGTRTVRLGEPLMPTDDDQADLEILLRFFRRVKGRHPAQAFPPPDG
jgi:Acyltransferase